uniref:Uncharacterized protein n=1 Tax=Oryza sativa subsp. japonica TaxID=39947 RepID=Q10K90_ORYSJ|nr:hypothetical protein LOC_Os03g27484 [Oryza sativa Japonica Group]
MHGFVRSTSATIRTGLRASVVKYNSATTSLMVCCGVPPAFPGTGINTLAFGKASSTLDATSALLQELSKDFALKDLGDLHYFLDIEVHKMYIGQGLQMIEDPYEVLLYSWDLI